MFFSFRRKLHNFLTEKQNCERIEQESAIIISRTFKSYIAQKTLRDLKVLHDEVLKKSHSAATTIAHAYRHFYFLICFKRRTRCKKQRHNFATKIQCFFRLRVASREVNRIKECHRKRQILESAVVIQRAMRRRAAILVSKKLLSKCELLNCLKAEKAVHIRRWWRGVLGRKRAILVKAGQIEEIKDQLRMELWAATTISAAWRGKMNRKRVKSIRSDKLCGDAWKEMYSEEESRYFYYNQVKVFMAMIFCGTRRYLLYEFLLFFRNKLDNIKLFAEYFSCSVYW